MIRSLFGLHRHEWATYERVRGWHPGGALIGHEVQRCTRCGRRR